MSAAFKNTMFVSNLKHNPRIIGYAKRGELTRLVRIRVKLMMKQIKESKIIQWKDI